MGAIALLMLGAFMSTSKRPAVVVCSVFRSRVVVAAVAVFQGSGSATVFGGAFVSDGFTRFLKIVILVGAA